VSESREFELRRTAAGPFVSVITLSGPVVNGAQQKLEAELAAPGLSSKRVVVDLTEATLYDSWPFPLLVDETRRFRADGGALVVVSGQNTTVDPFVEDGSLGELRWCKSLDDALMELLAEVVELAGWSTELPEAR
jgi:anti-anti-sigma regulatory factor